MIQTCQYCLSEKFLVNTFAHKIHKESDLNVKTLEGSKTLNLDIDPGFIKGIVALWVGIGTFAA